MIWKNVACGGHTAHFATKTTAVEPWSFDSYGPGLSESTAALRFLCRGSIVVVQHAAQPFQPPDPSAISHT
jgi:hypothetical protein